MISVSATMRVLGKAALVLMLGLFALSATADAQPTLSFNRISVNWPTISLFVQVKCGSDLRLDLTTANFKIVENGIEIGDFTVSCPDPNRHCCISVALIFDRSGSMGWGSPSGLEGAKEAGKAFVDAMDPDGSGCDEATVVSFNQQVTVDVFMTNDKVLLKQGIDGLVANGNTAVWDAGVVGVQELVNNGTQECRAVILLTDGEDNSSTNTPDDVIALALNNKIRIFTIGLGTGINDADLQRIATDTGGKYYKAPNPSVLVGIYKEISTIIGGGFYECEITYQAKCMDGTRRNVDLTLMRLLGCPGTDTKTKSYRAPRDTTTFDPVTIRLGTETVTGGQTVDIPLYLDTPINEIFNKCTFKILFDEQCCQYVKYDTQGYLLNGVPIDVQPIAGGIQVSTLAAKAITDAGILMTFRFKASDPENDTECPLRLFGWVFEAGCLRPVLVNGKIIIVARKPEVECSVDMVDELIFDRTAKDYTPNPFGATVVVTNKGTREARNGVATIIYNKNDVTLATPLSPKQPLTPKNVKENGGQSLARWDILAKKRQTGDSVEICFDVTFDNHPTIHCCKKVWVPPTQPIILCKLSAPTIKTNAARDRYVPMPFTVTADIWNDGGIVSDSLYARIEWAPDLDLAPTENHKTIKVVAPYRLQPNQHGTVSWQMIHPIAIDLKNYTVTVTVRERGQDSTICEIPINIPPLLAPSLNCTVLAPNQLTYDSTIDAYLPNPFSASVQVRNNGGLDADSVRATIILPPDLVLDPPTQPVTKYFNPMKVVKWAPSLPVNQLDWTIRATKKPKSRKCYNIQFRIDGTSTTGPVDPSYCDKDVCVPAVAPLLACTIYGPDSLGLNATKTGVIPNPFTIRYVARNVGKQPYGLRDAYLSIFNGPGVYIQTANPVAINKTLNPGDSVEADFQIRVTNSRTGRVPRFTVIGTDEDGDPLECDMDIPIAFLDVDLACAAYGPDTIHYDRFTETHSPNPFNVRFELFNAGGDFLNNVRDSLMNIPPELEVIGETGHLFPIMGPGRTETNEFQLQLSPLGLSLTTGKTVRVGVFYQSDEIQRIEGDCYVDIYIEPVIKPKLECALTGPDTLYFVNDRYVPDIFDIGVTVWNRGNGPADEVKAFVLQDPRFTIIPPANRDLVQLMPPQDSLQTSFTLKVNPRQTDGSDTVRVAVVATGTAPSYCEKPIFIYRELRPKFSILCQATPDTLTFNDQLNDYVPNPFTVRTIAQNIGETFADNCQLVFVGPQRFTPAGSPVVPIGDPIGHMEVGRIDTAFWQVRALRRDVGGMDTLIFQVQGSGGMGNKIVLAECRVPVYVPPARAAAYTLTCIPSFQALQFLNGQYLPDPFRLDVIVKNTGSADGRKIIARPNLPPGITLAGGETVSKNVPDLKVGDSAMVGWLLRPITRKTDDTLDIIVGVTDGNGTEGQCTAQVFVPKADNAALVLQCSTPDTIRVDKQLGVYRNNPFNAVITVVNKGLIAADSVCVAILITSPDQCIRMVSPSIPYQCVANALPPNGQVRYTWQLLALPRSISGPVEIRFTATAHGLAPVDVVCNTYIPELGQPNLQCAMSTTPPDTLHFVDAIGDYEGIKSSSGRYNVFKVNLTVTNRGQAQARNVQATLIPPLGTTLDEGEVATKSVTPTDLAANDSGSVSWSVMPIRAPIGDLKRFNVVFKSDGVAQKACAVDLFVQGSPIISHLTIPTDNLGSFGDKIHVPVYIDETIGKGINEYRFRITFDTTVVKFIQAYSKGSMTEFGWNGPRHTFISNNEVEIHDLTTGSPIQKGSGTLVYLVFEAVFGGPDKSLEVAKSPIAFTDKAVSSAIGKTITLATDGEVTVSGYCIKPMEAGANYVLRQNRPNPFNPSTTIEFTIPEDTQVSLKVMDALGRVVAVLVQEARPKGTYTVNFDAGDLSSGVYYYKLETPNYTKILSMTLAR